MRNTNISRSSFSDITWINSKICGNSPCLWDEGLSYYLIRTCFFTEESYRNATWVSRRKNHNVVAGWIAVLRLFRNIGWDKLGASSGKNPPNYQGSPQYLCFKRIVFGSSKAMYGIIVRIDGYGCLPCDGGAVYNTANKQE